MLRIRDLDRQRLLPDWQPGCWIGAQRRMSGPQAEVVVDDAGDHIENRPAQSLIVLWGPQSLDRPFLPRLPFMVQLTSRGGDDAVAELLRHVPPTGALWLDASHVDWALMAEIVMLTEATLRPWQHRELARFILRERETLVRAVRESYMGREEDERYRPTSPGDLI
ncbi:MAG: hypothetical protein ACKVQR_00600 [Aquabacterium sp.]